MTITDTLPAALNAVSWTSSGSVITARVGSTYAWDVEDLPAGTGGVITVTGTINEAYQGTLPNTAEIATTSRETETTNNTSRFAVQVAPITTDVKVTDLTIEGSSPPRGCGQAIR